MNEKDKQLEVLNFERKACYFAFLNNQVQSDKMKRFQIGKVHAANHTHCDHQINTHFKQNIYSYKYIDVLCY